MPATHQPIQLGIARQNGLSTGNEGTWKQTKEEIEINIPLEDRARAKDIECQITSTTLRIGFRGQEPILSETLYEKCDAEESSWQIISQEAARHGEPTKTAARCIQITLIKKQPTKWEHYLKREE